MNQDKLNELGCALIVLAALKITLLILALHLMGIPFVFGFWFFVGACLFMAATS